MSTEKNVQTVKDFFAAIGRGDREGLLALVAEDVEWIIPDEDWPLAGTRHGHAGLADLVKTQSETMEISLTEPREFVSELLLGGHVTRVQQAGVVSAADAERWWTDLREAHEAGTFFYAVTALIVAGTKG
jgi:ketosteroid isomerase-like protein